VHTVRSASRPERHFADSFIIVRLAIALFLAAGSVVSILATAS
jgi:hypothetical protein